MGTLPFYHTSLIRSTCPINRDLLDYNHSTNTNYEYLT